jgi:hypothetical protein
VEAICVDLYGNAGCTGQPVASSTTSPEGTYQFTSVLPGIYCLQFGDIPAKWSISPQAQGSDDALDSDADPASGKIEGLDLTAERLDQDMGVYAQGSVGGGVWCDTNGNYRYDSGEGVAGVTVTLNRDGECDGQGDGTFGTQDSGSDGQYLFANLPAGPSGSPECYVVEVDSTGMGACEYAITPTRYSVAVDTGALDELDNDFGFSPKPQYTYYIPLVMGHSSLRQHTFWKGVRPIHP